MPSYAIVAASPVLERKGVRSGLTLREAPMTRRRESDASDDLSLFRFELAADVQIGFRLGAVPLGCGVVAQGRVASDQNEPCAFLRTAYLCGSGRSPSQDSA